MKNKQKHIYTSYDKDLDITFILKDDFEKEDSGNLKHLSTEVVGFYFGEPNEEDTEKYEGRLKATFEL